MNIIIDITELLIKTQGLSIATPYSLFGASTSLYLWLSIHLKLVMLFKEQ